MKWLNNKLLLVILAVLLTGFVLTKLFRSPSLESNLDEDLLKVDTSKVTEIKLYPLSEGRRELKLVREGKAWKVKREPVSANTESYQVSSLLGTLATLKPQRMVSRKKEKWDSYAVGDTTGVQLIALNNGDEIANLRIGNEVSGQTYIRVNDQDEVYAAGGYIRQSVDKNFNSWRDKSFLHLDKEMITKIEFHYPADSGFVVEKKANTWMIGETRSDSVSIDNYLNRLRFKNFSDFADDFSASSQPDVTVKFGTNLSTSTTIKGWKKSFFEWVVTSDLQPEVYFLVVGNDAMKELFPSAKGFTASPK